MTAFVGCLGGDDEPETEPNSGAWLLGILLMVPAYYFGALVCLRAMS